jgi:hypothetical protein
MQTSAAGLPQLEFAQHHVFGWCDPGARPGQVDPAPVGEGPVVEWIARRHVDVGLELAAVMDDVEHAASTPPDSRTQRLVRRHVVVRLGELALQGCQVGWPQQQDHVDIGSQPRLAVDAGGDRACVQ